MSKTREDLTRELRKVGYSSSAIDAAWPSWWTDEAETSASSRTELRFALSRRLGLSPRPLLGERVEYFWNDAAGFKHLRVHEASERAAISSFGIALGQELIKATTAVERFDWRAVRSLQLRETLLQQRPFVDLLSLMTACWSFGIPVIHLNVVPLEAKSMHAMVVHHKGRYAILLARNARYPAITAFTLAHELGHVLLGHLEGVSALVDLEDPAATHDEDAQEREADQFALELLTGTNDPIIEPDRADYNAPMLANAAMEGAPTYQVEPGTIALTLAYRDGSWARTMAALKFIYGEGVPVSRLINRLANQMLNWNDLPDDVIDYLNRVMAEKNG